jgi:hypothetical protein
MYMIRMFVALLVAAALSACGGGGGSPGTTSTGNGGTSPAPTVSLQLVDANGAATTAISATESTFARATVTDASGNPVSGVVVTFTTDATLVGFVPSSGTALTGSNGVAQIQLTPASGSSAGAGTLNGDATVGGTAAKQGTVGYQVVATSGTGSGVVPASIEIFSSAPQVSSSPNSTVSFTVVVKDAQNRTMPTQTVTFSATSGDLSGALPARVTGSAGEPITGVTLSPGRDQSNRNIVLTATAGAIQQVATVAVTGTTISLGGANSVLLGGTTSFTVTARDSAGVGIAGVPVAVTSSLGNGLSPSSVVTDSSGAAQVSYLASRSGVDTLSASGVGTSAAKTIAISAEDFAFVSPPANSSIAIGSSQAISVRLLSGGVPVAGRTVTFSTTRGTLSAATATTDVNGQASTTVSSTTAGPATIAATAGTSQALLPLTFVASQPATLVLQANPGAVAPNQTGSTANQATIQATVRDASGNPVAGSVVNFTALSDLSNGTISPGSGVTDANGIVSVQFIPGALTTASNGVEIQATVQGSGVSGTTFLTVSGQALFISIGRGVLLSQTTDPVYKKEFSVYVTDANGAAVPNKTVTLSVWPDQYMKGYYTVSAPPGSTTPIWLQGPSPAGITALCANEDLNRNGILDSGEDTNVNGKLDPGLPIVVTPSSVTTDSGGFATFYLQYGKNFATWLNTTITARATAAGTESVQTQGWVTEALSADITNIQVTPPFITSPFGVASSCSDPN